MRLAEVLRPDTVRTNLEAADKDGLLRALAGIFSECDSVLDAETVYRVFSERERLASTGVGSGVAIPHGRLDIRELRAVMAICPSGVAFDSIDGLPTRIVVAVLGPIQHPAEQLKMLARISRVLKDQAVRDRLLAAQSCEDVCDIVAEAELSH